MLQISRTPVREALKFLGIPNCPANEAGGGTFVADPGEISISMPLNFKIKLEGISWERSLISETKWNFLY